MKVGRYFTRFIPQKSRYVPTGTVLVWLKEENERHFILAVVPRIEVLRVRAFDLQRCALLRMQAFGEGSTKRTLHGWMRKIKLVIQREPIAWLGIVMLLLLIHIPSIKFTLHILKRAEERWSSHEPSRRKNVGHFTPPSPTALPRVHVCLFPCHRPCILLCTPRPPGTHHTLSRAHHINCHHVVHLECNM